MAHRLSSWTALLCFAATGISCSSSIAADGRTAPPPGGAVPQPAPRPSIREFDLPTLARLGRELYRQDQLAWVATDALTAEVDKAKLSTELTSGWIVDVAGSEPVVRFLRKTATGVEAAYDVIFPSAGKPVVRVPSDRALTSAQLARHHAVQTAQKALIDGHFPLWRDPYNTVVLEDPAGDGLLAYFLRSKTATEVIPVGGHYRITVSADGRTLRQVDRLFATFLTVNRGQVPQGGTMVAATMSHVISNTPLETHVFLSLQEHLPFYVITPDRRVWEVKDGSITLTTMDLSPSGAPSPAR